MTRRLARSTAIALAIAAITISWVNTRAFIFNTNHGGARPAVLGTYSTYHAMATGLREGRIGQVDVPALERYNALNDPWAPYERLPPGAEHRWVNYYTLDVGYSFIVAAARFAFPSVPDNHLRALMLQVVVDGALVFFVFFLFSQWNLWLGLAAAYLYTKNVPFYDLVSFAYYYFWDIPLAFIVLGSMLLAYRRPTDATRWLTLAGLALGFGVWLRASWWPLSLFLLAVAAWPPALRRKLLVPVVAFAVLAVPQFARASIARGRPALSTRTVWHVALVGLGYYPNAYGLEANDGVIFNLTKTKYGVAFRAEDYWEHDQAARSEFLRIWRDDRGFVVRSFLGRLKESILGTTQTSVLSFVFFENPTYRLVCLAGFVAMLLRGAEKRLLAIAAGGAYAIYVVISCLFYFVGLAYANVSEVTLFFLFMGGIEALTHLMARGAHRPLRVPRLDRQTVPA